MKVSEWLPAISWSNSHRKLAQGGLEMMLDAFHASFSLEILTTHLPGWWCQLL